MRITFWADWPAWFAPLALFLVMFLGGLVVVGIGVAIKAVGNKLNVKWIKWLGNEILDAMGDWSVP